MKKLAITLISAATFLFGSSSNIIYVGDTYDFAEEDMLVAIHKYIEENKEYLTEKFNKEQKKMKQKAINFKPDGLTPLTPAIKNRTFYPDMTYVLDRDIADAEGKIIYKKGFSFNPLDYTHLSYGIVVINGNNRNEVKWFKQSKYANTIAYRLFITDGNYYDLNKELGQNIFYCLPKIKERFKLEHTPSIVTQHGNKMEVKELCLTCSKEKKQ